MKKVVLLYCFFFCIAIQGYAEISKPLEYIEQDFDVTLYYAFIDFTNIPNKEIKAVSNIELYWQKMTDSSKFYFHLRSLTVDSVFYNSIKTTAIEVGTPDDSTYHYEITPISSNVGDTAIISIYYHGKMTEEKGSMKWGGVHYDDNVLYSLGVGFFNNYVSTTQHWLACYDHPSDKAKFSCEFRVPKGYFVASNGDNVVFEKNDTTDSYAFWNYAPIATYLMTFNIGKFIEQKQEDSIAPIYVYTQAKDTTASKFAFQKVLEMLSYFTETFGEYPFIKVGYVITDKGSMESQTMINFSRAELRNVYNLGDRNNPTAAHELSHQWFGDAITPKDFRDVWLNESFATYCEALWLGKANYEMYYYYDMFSKRNAYINTYLKSEGAIPLYDFPRNDTISNYPGTIYYKGAVVLHLLRDEVGENQFFEILKKYYETYKYKNISTAEFINFFNTEAGKNYNWFFDQWVYGKGVPQIYAYVTYKPSTTGKKYSITKIKYEQRNPEGWPNFDKFYLNASFLENGKPLLTNIIKFSNWHANDLKFDPPIDCDTLSFSAMGNITLADVREVTYQLETSVQDNEDLAQYIDINNNQLKMDFSKFPAANFKIYDLMGRLVMQDNQSNPGMKTYDLNNLSRGFYNLVVFDNSRLLFTKKIIIE